MASPSESSPDDTSVNRNNSWLDSKLFNISFFLVSSIPLSLGWGYDWWIRNAGARELPAAGYTFSQSFSSAPEATNGPRINCTLIEYRIVNTSTVVLDSNFTLQVDVDEPYNKATSLFDSGLKYGSIGAADIGCSQNNGATRITLAAQSGQMKATLDPGHSIGVWLWKPNELNWEPAKVRLVGADGGTDRIVTHESLDVSIFGARNRVNQYLLLFGGTGLTFGMLFCFLAFCIYRRFFKPSGIFSTVVADMGSDVGRAVVDGIAAAVRDRNEQSETAKLKEFSEMPKIPDSPPPVPAAKQPKPRKPSKSQTDVTPEK